MSDLDIITIAVGGAFFAVAMALLGIDTIERVIRKWLQH